MDEVEFINMITATVEQATHRRVVYFHLTSDFTAEVGVEGGASHEEKSNAAVLLPKRLFIAIHDADGASSSPT